MVSTLLLSKAFKYGEISVVVTIWKLQVVLLAVLGILFLNETINAMGMAGILVSLFGVAPDTAVVPLPRPELRPQSIQSAPVQVSFLHFFP